MIFTWLLGKVFLLIAKRWAPDLLATEEEPDPIQEKRCLP